MLSTFIIISVFTFSVFILGAVLTYIAHRFKVEPKDPMQHLVEACLPQVQCGQCGYVGCAEYANAILLEGAPINLCPPGGDKTVRAIAEVLHMPIPKKDDGASLDEEEQTAFIDASLCIGCGKCAKACPFDAISGKLKEPHLVHEEFCTACRKCLETCPKNCITMQKVTETIDNWNGKVAEGPSLFNVEETNGHDAVATLMDDFDSDASSIKATTNPKPVATAPNANAQEKTKASPSDVAPKAPQANAAQEADNK